jgi:hypothetical protein
VQSHPEGDGPNDRSTDPPVVLPVTLTLDFQGGDGWAATCGCGMCEPACVEAVTEDELIAAIRETIGKAA